MNKILILTGVFAVLFSGAYGQKKNDNDVPKTEHNFNEKVVHGEAPSRPERHDSGSSQISRDEKREAQGVNSNPASTGRRVSRDLFRGEFTGPVTPIICALCDTAASAVATVTQAVIVSYGIEKLKQKLIKIGVPVALTGGAGFIVEVIIELADSVPAGKDSDIVRGNQSPSPSSKRAMTSDPADKGGRRN